MPMKIYIIFVFITNVMIVQELLETLEQWAPTAYAENFDNVGLLIGDKECKCSGVMITLDCTEAVADEAIAEKLQCNYKFPSYHFFRSEEKLQVIVMSKELP